MVRARVGAAGGLRRERGATVKVDVPATLRVVCDAHKMQGVIMNLVKNAVEAGQERRVARARRDGEAIIEVADDGPGLSEDAQAHLFEPFFTTKPNGTGLGLPTSRRYVRRTAASIEAAGAARLGGALFRMRLPVEAGERRPRRGEGRMKPSVLVIDDEKTFRIVAEEALAPKGST